MVAKVILGWPEAFVLVGLMVFLYQIVCLISGKESVSLLDKLHEPVFQEPSFKVEYEKPVQDIDYHINKKHNYKEFFGVGYCEGYSDCYAKIEMNWHKSWTEFYDKILKGEKDLQMKEGQYGKVGKKEENAAETS